MAAGQAWRLRRNRHIRHAVKGTDRYRADLPLTTGHSMLCAAVECRRANTTTTMSVGFTAFGLHPGNVG